MSFTLFLEMDFGVHQNKFTFARIQPLIDMRYTLLFISLSLITIPALCVGQNTVYKDSIVNKATQLIDLSNDSQGNPELRFAYADSALKIANDLGDGQLIAKTLINYGQACYSVGKYNEAINSGKKSLEFFLLNNDTANQAIAYNFIGACYLRQSRYQTAIEFIDKTIQLSKILKDSIRIASGYNNLGIVHFNLERYREAEEYFKHSLDYSKNTQSLRHIARTQGNIGLSYLKQNNINEAIQWFEKSLKIRIDLKDTLMLASIYDNIGNAHENLGNIEKSEEYYKLSNTYFKKLNSSHGIALSNIALARINLLKGNWQSAYKNIIEGQKIALQNQETDLVMQSFKILSEYYQKIGNTEKSRSALEEYIKYLEKSFNEKTTTRIAELRVQLETAQNEQNNQALRAKLELQQLQATQNNRIKTILTVFAIILSILLGFTILFIVKLRNRNKEIKRINYQLLHFNDELETLVKDRTKNLSEALEKVKELEKVKSAFLSNISHEIRTPLNGILGFTQYLLSSSISDDDKEHYGRLIQKLGNRLLRIVDDILELSKVETNQLEIHYTDYNINELLSDLYQSYSNNEDFLAKNLNFRFIKSLPDSQAIYSIDVYRVKKILAHLIENAIKFTNIGSVEFGYYADSPSTLKFFVKDTGIGIPKKAQRLVFERFYKHIAEDQFTLYEGTGVGLAIAKGFALAMGGRIEVESVPNHGSTFYLYIPKKTPEQSSLNANHPKFDSWDDKTILIVEDDLISYQYIEALLSRTNVRLIHVKNAEDAIEVCHINSNLNLILLDIQLPFMNGIEAARIIRQNNKNVPIITQTANTISEESKACLDAGCNAFITKPIDPDELFNLINKLII